MIDKQFDDILKRKLNDMTETSNSDWSSFEQKLDNALSNDATVLFIRWRRWIYCRL